MASHYNETLLRRDFLDPFFTALGWDMQNRRGYAEVYREVIHEESVKIGVSSKSPDYTFRIGVTRQFFVEAKKPAVDILSSFDPALQIRTYAWSAGLPLSILTNFKWFVVYDCTKRPLLGDRPSDNIAMKISYDEYLDRWDEISSVFAREEILRGGFDKFAAQSGKRRGTEQVDAAFLEQIDGWRKELAKNIARNNNIEQADLNYAVGQIIDRIIFLRICEDRGTEEYGQLQKLLKPAGVYGRLIDAFKRADKYYNSGLFYLAKQRGRPGEPDEISTTLTITDSVFRDILNPLYEQNSYKFDFLPVDILGQVYEQFLGRVIQLKGHKAEVLDKPEIKKAGGVVYTPSYVVTHIVDHTLGKLCSGKSPSEMKSLRILDPACGSGSFLLGAYDCLLKEHLKWYLAHGGAKKGYIYETIGGWRLSEMERRRILLDNIYGVDIDAQAVEVTKLSLLLKLLEGSTKDAIEAQLRAIHEPALPDLDANIRAGNSLIGPDFYKMPSTAKLNRQERQRVNAFDWSAAFSATMADGGFDAVIGNPPYVLLQGEFRDDLQSEYFRSHYSAAFKLDLYHLFIEKSIALTKLGGMCSLITPSNYLTNNYMANLRRKMIEGSLESIMIIDGKVFPRRAVDACIFVANKTKKPKKTISVIRANAQPGFPILSTIDLDVAHIIATDEVLFTGGNRAANDAWSRIARTCVELGTLAFVNFGKQLRDRELYGEDVIEVPDADHIPAGYSACYTGDDIERYALKWHNLACLTDTVAQSGGCWNPRRQDEANKILTRQIGFWPEYAIDTNGYQCLNTVFMLNAKSANLDMKCLMGLLNSKVVRAFWLDKFYDRRRTFPKIKGTYLKKIPIPNTIADWDGSEGGPFFDILANVERAIGLRESLKKASPRDRDFIKRDCEAVDAAIDRLAYQAYGLSGDEIATIEDIVKKQQDLEATFRKRIAAAPVVPKA